MSYIEKEKLIKADIASIENRVRHAFKQGYNLGFKDGKERTIAKKDLQKATNKIIECSLDKWYVGRTDGKSEEVVLLEDVISILNDLLNKGANNEQRTI